MADGTLKVGTITTSSGSGTITLGQSGETITIPTGATITNSGTSNGFGGANTPAFVAYKTSNQSISNTTTTKVTFEAEQVDSGTVYDTSTSKFTPGETGYYWIGAKWRYDTGTDFDSVSYYLYKNGSIISKSVFVNQNSNGNFLNTIVYAGSTSDYYEWYGYQNSGGSVNINGNSTYPEQDQAQFYAFKIIGL
jgi:hypothetical protein